MARGGKFTGLKGKIFIVVAALFLFGVINDMVSDGPTPSSNQTTAAPPLPEEPQPQEVRATGRAEGAIARFALWGLEDGAGEEAQSAVAGEAPPSNPLAENLFLIVDGSGSMLNAGCSDGRPKIDVARESILRFIDTVPETTNLGLLMFDARGHNLWSTLETNNREDIRTAINDMQADGGTPLGIALDYVMGQLRGQAALQRGYGDYRVVVVTDGEASDEFKLNSVMNELLDTPVMLYTVGFCIDENHALNIPGQTFYAAATSPQELERGLNAVLAESEAFDLGQGPVQFQDGNGGAGQ
ncbi:MAG: vWA domain-containing protein [Rhodospirillaceae bacterium]